MQSQVFRAAAFATALTLSGAFTIHAHAADLGGGGMYSPPPPPPAYSQPIDYSQWAGWYFGGVLGYGWTDFPDMSGVHGGALLGYNYQMGRVVAGIEGDLIASGIDGSSSLPGGTASGDANWGGSIRGRLGVSVMPELLIFATLGYNWTDYDLALSGAGGGSASEVFGGIQYGAGAEVKLTGNWSARLDYLHTDFSSEAVTFAGGSTVRFDPDTDEVRGAIVYKF